jgi:hypothetical protein
MFIVSLMTIGQYFIEKHLRTAPGGSARQPGRVLDRLEEVETA